MFRNSKFVYIGDAVLLRVRFLRIELLTRLAIFHVKTQIIANSMLILLFLCAVNLGKKTKIELNKRMKLQIEANQLQVSQRQNERKHS